MADKKKGALPPQEGQEQTGNGGTGEVKTRKTREVKVKHAAGSPHEVLTTFVNGLSPTQADYLHRHVIKPAIEVEKEGLSPFEKEIFTAIKEKLAQ